MDQALSQIFVLDLTTSISGAFGTMLMSDLGATVAKVEDPKNGDPMRCCGPEINGVHPLFTAYNRNKKSIALNLEDSNDLKTLKKILPQFDVLIDDLPADVMRKYKLDYESLKDEHPSLITVSISAFGNENAYQDRPAFEETLQAESGLSFSIIDLGNGTPYNISGALVETTGGYYAIIPLLAALHEKHLTGRGQRIDVNKYFCTVSMLHFNILNYKYHNILYPGHGGEYPIGFARSKDSMVLIISASDTMWKRTVSLIDDPVLHDPKFLNGNSRKENEGFLIERIEKWLIQYTSKEIDGMFTKAGIPIGFIRNIEDLAIDPHIADRNLIVKIDVPDIGPMSFFANTIRLADSESVYRRAPRLGEHTAEFCDSVMRSDSKLINDEGGDGR